MEKKEIIKVCENGKIRDLTDEEITEFKKQNEYVPNQECTISYDEAVNLRIRERYSESQEFSILRQKDEKPDEFAEYYAFCEECKASAKEIFKAQEEKVQNCEETDESE